MSFKSDVIELLAKFFGAGIRGPIELSYKESQDWELFFLARKMLSEHLGPENAKQVLNKFLEKYPYMKEEVFI